MSVKKIIKIILTALIIVSITGYVFYQFRNVIFGPKVEILSPTNGSKFNKSFTQISGTSKNVSKISINDKPIFIDTDGNFIYTIVLLDGYNIITIKAEDRFGREIVKVLELVLKADKNSNTVNFENKKNMITEENINNNTEKKEIINN